MNVFIGVAVVAGVLGGIAGLVALAVEDGREDTAVTKQKRRIAKMLQERPFERFERDEQRWFHRHLANDALDMAEKVLEQRRPVL